MAGSKWISPFALRGVAVAFGIVLGLASAACGSDPDDENGTSGAGGIAAGGTGGDAGQGGTGGTAGSGGHGGTGGSGGGGAPCTETTMEDPACIECLQEALPACEEHAGTTCAPQMAALTDCAHQNGCVTPGDQPLDIACLLANCRQAAEFALACMMSCEALADCIAP